MKVTPFNNRLLIEEIKEVKNNKDVIATLDFAKERKEIPKFMHVKILNIATNLTGFEYLKGQEAYIETGFLEEIVIDNKMYRFCPINYLVAVVQPEDLSIKDLINNTKEAIKSEIIK